MGTICTWFLYVVGIFYTIVGVLLVFNPKVVINKFLKKIRNMSLPRMAVITILFSILVLLSAAYNKYTFFLRLIGVIGLIKGVVFIMAEDKMKKMMDWWFSLSMKIKRIWGVLAILVGSIILMGI